jgi:hypothetical protein
LRQLARFAFQLLDSVLGKPWLWVKRYWLRRAREHWPVAFQQNPAFVRFGRRRVSSRLVQIKLGERRRSLRVVALESPNFRETYRQLAIVTGHFANP